MKKLVLIAAAAAVLTTQAYAAKTGFASAEWKATAKKDTTSDLVVAGQGSLKFNYLDDEKVFTPDRGAFKVTILGDAGASDFKLTSRVVQNTLKRTSDDSTLTVGVDWKGTALSETSAVAIVDSTNANPKGLINIANSYKKPERVSEDSEFKFTIASATSDGTTPASFEDLADGVWSGDVEVLFTATWTD